MSKKPTQRDLVVQYIKDFGSISSWQAYADLGITQLGARIYELKERGYVFEKERVKTLNRYGKPAIYEKYTIISDGTEVGV